MTDLFTPIKLGPFTLPNRIFMTPMTRNRALSTAPNELMKTCYSERASSGLIISEGSQVSLQAIGYPRTPRIHTSNQVAGWKELPMPYMNKAGVSFANYGMWGESHTPTYKKITNALWHPLPLDRKAMQ